MGSFHNLIYLKVRKRTKFTKELKSYKKYYAYDCPTEVRLLSCYGEHFISGNKAAKKCFKSFLEMWTSIKFLNLKHATESIFVYSIQLSMYLFKHETCKFVYTPSYYHFYISAHTYNLKSGFIFCQIVFNVVCKAFSCVQIKVYTWQ